MRCCCATRRRFQQNNLTKFQASAERAGIPWRMSETATLYGGGKPGVSDSFASALWVLDYLFVLARFGAAGANLQTGINHLGTAQRLFAHLRRSQRALWRGAGILRLAGLRPDRRRRVDRGGG
jgi:hypothetical protein